MTEAYMRLQEENAKLSARVERLTAALKPFAEIAKELQPHLATDYKNEMRWAVPTVGAFREVLAALGDEQIQRPSEAPK